ncbi:rhamnan synthesis F family protein [Bradyrhizobium elkanii]|uniref:rhamnan synthesis F family protein n=1 Tax=Bradyrhizobium elkanii TaxID=29448 RepID=UPI003D192989
MTELKSFARLVQAPLIAIQDLVIGAAARLVRRKLPAREHLRGDDPLRSSKKAAIYVHFDSQGTIHEYHIHQLRELMEAGFRITFVSNAPHFSDSSRRMVRPFCKNIIWRYNVGYDFGAYKDGIASLENLDQIDTLALMNDSIYGPFWKLTETLSAIDESRYDFWGIVDSWEQRRYHLQTFFILFFSKALRSTAFKSFWRRYPYVNNKPWVIRNGEIELTQVLAYQQMRAGALASYWSVAETIKDRLEAFESATLPPAKETFRARLRRLLLTGRPINPMHFFWDVLITDYKCPFIKRELLKANPAGISTATEWAELIASNTPHDVSVIQKHLAS